MQGIGRSANQQRGNVRRPEGRRGERVGLTADWLGCTRYNGRVLQGASRSSCSEREAGIARGVKWQAERAYFGAYCMRTVLDVCWGDSGIREVMLWGGVVLVSLESETVWE